MLAVVVGNKNIASKLTFLLQDLLGSMSKTIIIANNGPTDYNYNEMLSTLRYAHRVKAIQNKPVKNDDNQRLVP